MTISIPQYLNPDLTSRRGGGFYLNPDLTSRRGGGFYLNPDLTGRRGGGFYLNPDLTSRRSGGFSHWFYFTLKWHIYTVFSTLPDEKKYSLPWIYILYTPGDMSMP